MEPRNIVVVGAGHAGGRVVGTLRASGFRGRITAIGRERFPPYERPPLSKELLFDRYDYKTTYLRSERYYAENSIDLRLDEIVTRVDAGAHRIETNTGYVAAYDRLVLATGGRPRRLKVPGSELRGVHYLRGIDDALELRDRLRCCSRLAVIGGGFISLEVAAAARRLGVEVDVVEMQPAILGRVLSSEFAGLIRSIHESRGVRFHTGCQVEEILGRETVSGIRLDSCEVLDADLVVVGIGIVPEMELASEAGLEVDNGVLVNGYGETEDPHIFAVGDVCNCHNSLYGRRLRIESWHNAESQAAHVARLICGQRTACTDVPWFWSDQFDFNLQMAGVFGTRDSVIRRTYDNGAEAAEFHLAGDTLVCAVALNRARDIAAARKFIARRARMDAAALADPHCDLRRAVIVERAPPAGQPSA